MKDMNTKPYSDFLHDSVAHYLNVLCAIGRHTKFQPQFTWSPLVNDFDVKPVFPIGSAKSSAVLNKNLQAAVRCSDIWEEEVRKIEDDGRKLYPSKTERLLTMKLAVSYIYHKLMENLNEKQLGKASFSHVSVVNNEIRYTFQYGSKQVYVVFIGDEMDEFLEQVKVETMNKRDKTLPTKGV